MINITKLQKYAPTIGLVTFAVSLFLQIIFYLIMTSSETFGTGKISFFYEVFIFSYHLLSTILWLSFILICRELGNNLLTKSALIYLGIQVFIFVLVEWIRPNIYYNLSGLIPFMTYIEHITAAAICFIILSIKQPCFPFLIKLKWLALLKITLIILNIITNYLLNNNQEDTLNSNPFEARPPIFYYINTISPIINLTFSFICVWWLINMRRYFKDKYSGLNSSLTKHNI